MPGLNLVRRIKLVKSIMAHTWKRMGAGPVPPRRHCYGSPPQSPADIETESQGQDRRSPASDSVLLL
jgi:hypothetical protein